MNGSSSRSDSLQHQHRFQQVLVWLRGTLEQIQQPERLSFGQDDRPLVVSGACIQQSRCAKDPDLGRLAIRGIPDTDLSSVRPP